MGELGNLLTRERVPDSTVRISFPIAQHIEKSVTPKANPFFRDKIQPNSHTGFGCKWLECVLYV